MSKLVLSALVFAFLTASVPARAAYFEIGDAGDLLATAQATVGPAPLTSIVGHLDVPDSVDDYLDVDLFQIFIFDPLAFSAWTIGLPGVTVDDPQLFLFDSSGLAVYMNDDDESGTSGSQSLLPSGSLFGPASVGLYYLAIGWFDNEPSSLTGLMFEQQGTGTNGPDLGAGGSDPLAGWNGNVTGRADLPTAYEIRLAGTRAAVPEPGTMALVALGLTATFLRRRTQTKV